MKPGITMLMFMLLAMVMSVVGTGTATAEDLIHYTFTGTVTDVMFDPPSCDYRTAIDIGDYVEGTLTYDLDTPDTSLPSDPFGLYEHNSLPSGISVTINGHHFEMDSNYLFEIMVADNLLGTYDYWGALSSTIVPSSVGLDPSCIGSDPDNSLSLHDTSKTIFSDNSLLPIPSAGWTQKQGYVEIDEYTIITYSIDTLDCVDCVLTCTDNDEDAYSVEGGECGPVDCNDDDESIYPGAPDSCDGIDQSCDGVDGVWEIPGNGIDDDCNPATPAPWQVASVVGGEYRESSDTVNYLFLLMVPIGAIISLRIIRRKK